jgi:LacI family transcriptional regulator
MVTLLDIANAVGVRTATVSRVLNDKPNPIKVSDATKKKIFEAARALGYQPNAAARAVRSGRFRRIACVVPQYGHVGVPYYPAMASYLEVAADVLAEKGYSIVFEPFHLDWQTGELQEPPRLFVELAADGILGVAATDQVPAHVDEKLSRLRAPTVWVNRNASPNAVCIMCDEAEGARQLTQHLIDLGHRRIGYVGMDGSHYSKTDRYRAFSETLRRQGLEPMPGELPSDRGTWCQVAGAMLDRIDRPTAVVCYDRPAYDATLFEAARRGLRVPEQLSIGYFASSWNRIDASYQPTLIELPEVTMTRVAVDRLMAVIEGRKDAVVPNPIVGTLHVGQTTARPL